jgi:trehalose 6-phosphate phosphatase
MQPAEILTNPDRWALFLDVDGTILDVAATPDDVEVPANLVRSLQRIEPLLSGALALVSGRTIATLDRLLPRCRPLPAKRRRSGARATDRALLYPAA